MPGSCIQTTFFTSGIASLAALVRVNFPTCKKCSALGTSCLNIYLISLGENTRVILRCNFFVFFQVLNILLMFVSKEPNKNNWKF
jgi:hypothetical protein